MGFFRVALYRFVSYHPDNGFVINAFTITSACDVLNTLNDFPSGPLLCIFWVVNSSAFAIDSDKIVGDVPKGNILM